MISCNTTNMNNINKNKQLEVTSRNQQKENFPLSYKWPSRFQTTCFFIMLENHFS
uniref:Uncharacterized protein MANES_02G080200 n=1 Tax=Rhizophora mucronata TaxID=61149 RepID=A0A2P2MZD1_RHIMU